MELADVLTPDRCLVGLRYGDKAACLGDLAKRAAAMAGLDKTAVLDALVHRERLGSTGLGGGIALPHARLAMKGAPLVLAARLREPIAFESVDDKPVGLVCLVLLPAKGADAPILACIARRLRDPAATAAWREAATADALYAALTGRPPGRQIPV